MPAFHQLVSLNGFHQESFMLTMKLSGLSAVFDQSPVGKAVSLDITSANTAKLAALDDVIIGRLMSFENRVNEGTVVGTVEFRFSATLPIASGQVVAVGDTVCGFASGEVKALAAKNYALNFVSEVIGANAVVVKF